MTHTERQQSEQMKRRILANIANRSKIDLLMKHTDHDDPYLYSRKHNLTVIAELTDESPIISFWFGEHTINEVDNINDAVKWINTNYNV